MKPRKPQNITYVRTLFTRLKVVFIRVLVSLRYPTDIRTIYSRNISLIYEKVQYVC